MRWTWVFVLGCATDPGDTTDPVVDTVVDTVSDTDCPDGFWGEDCARCTWESAGRDCEFREREEVYDVDAIAALTLEDLEWTETSVSQMGGVTVVEGSWVAGTYDAIDVNGDWTTIPLRQAAALYLPPGETPANDGKGLVLAAHQARKVISDTGAKVARVFEIPVLYFGEDPADWQDLGFASRGELNSGSGDNVRALNSCFLEDPYRGNFGYHLARTHLYAVTLLQRLAESHGGAVEAVALRGYSKEGKAAYVAVQYDPRVEVLSAGGAKLGSPSMALPSWWESYGCDTSTELGETGWETKESFEWLSETPAGAAFVAGSDLVANLDFVEARVFLLDGDQGAHDQHDGAHGQPPAADTAMLDALTVPWRYVRKNVSWDGAADGDNVTKELMPMLAAELLVEGPGAEDRLYPKVTAQGVLAGDELSVTASVSGPHAGAVLWWSWSEDRIWNDEGQQRWRAVDMAPDGADWSAQVTVPSGGVVGWYVETGFTATRAGESWERRDASPIRFPRLTPPPPCNYTPVGWCDLPDDG